MLSDEALNRLDGVLGTVSASNGPDRVRNLFRHWPTSPRSWNRWQLLQVDEDHTWWCSAFVLVCDEFLHLLSQLWRTDNPARKGAAEVSVMVYELPEHVLDRDCGIFWTTGHCSGLSEAQLVSAGIGWQVGLAHRRRLSAI